MSDRGRKALKAGAWYTVCTFLLRGVSFLTMPLFTRLMSVSEIGYYSNFTSWMSILGGVLTLDLYTSVNLAYYEYDKKISGFMSTIAIAGTVYTFILYLISLFFENSVISLLGINRYMFHIMFAYSLVHPAVSILHAKFRIFYEYKKTIITTLIPTGCSVLASLLLVCLFKNNRLEARTFGYYGIWIIFSISLYVYILVKGKTFDPDYLKFALPIALPLVFHLMASTVLSTSDRVMINKICGSEYTGYYSVAYSCAMIVHILWSAINQAWAPWCYDMLHAGEETVIRKTVKPIQILFCAGILIVILIAPEIMLLMGGRKYMQAVYVIPPVMLGFVAQMLYTFYVNIETFYKKQKQIMVGTMIAAACNVILNAVFIPRFGYIAAAYTTLAGYILLLFVHYMFVRRIGKHKIYDMRFNMILLTSSILVGILATFLYRMNAVRWSIIGLIILFVLYVVTKNRKALLSALKVKDIVGILRALHLAE